MRRRPILVLFATAAALCIPWLSGPLLPDLARVSLVAFGLLFLPGMIAGDAAGLAFHDPAESIVSVFILSLALLVPALLIALASGTGVATVVIVLLSSCALLALRGASTSAAATYPGHEPDDDATPAGFGLVALTSATLLVLTAAAVAATRTGSVDRWWYLGYVRAWANGPLFAHEPFLGTGVVQPRFAFHTWLGALSVWTRLSGVDPLWLFDRACPALLMPLAFAAHFTFGRALFRSSRGAWLAALCAGLLWAGGGPIAAMTRLPEDKVLAAVVLSPALWAFGIRACERGGPWTLAAALAAMAIATIHPLGFLLSAGPLVMFCAFGFWREPRSRHAIAGLLLVLAVASAYPLVSGFIVRRAYVSDGAAALSADHPVARVHRSRQRLVEIGKLGYIVDPHLLAHPIIWIALIALPLLRRRSSREAAFLAPAALIPLAIGFIPPLGAAAGALILPWMVHRVLWAIPFGALAAVAADEAATRLGGRAAVVAAALLMFSLPSARSAATERMREEREALALPAMPELNEALAALRALPASAIVAAAPELSERLPGLTSAHVLAMSDRATIVFAGTRAAGEARLRERAAIFAGLWKPVDDAPPPTHVLFAPGATAKRYCGTGLMQNERFVLCTFAPNSVAPGIRMPEVKANADGSEHLNVAALLTKSAAEIGRSEAAETRGAPGTNGAVSAAVNHTASATARCEPHPRLGVPSPAGLTRLRGGPWSAEFPLLWCSLERGTTDLLPRTLVVEPALGTAVEELTIQATGLRGDAQRWRVRTRRRMHNGETLRFGLPRGEVDRIVVEITPSFLPFVKLRSFELTLDRNQAQP